jgi:UDP-glucose 4-epimerase
VIAIFARALFEGRRPRIFGNGEQSRDFTYIDNVVQANLLAMDAELEPGQVVNVGTGERVTVNELWARMAELWGSDLEPELVSERPGDVRHSLASLERAEKLLGYRPAIGWEEGLVETLAWYRARFAAEA